MAFPWAQFLGLSRTLMAPKSLRKRAAVLMLGRSCSCWKCQRRVLGWVSAPRKVLSCMDQCTRWRGLGWEALRACRSARQSCGVGGEKAAVSAEAVEPADRWAAVKKVREQCLGRVAAQSEPKTVRVSRVVFRYCSFICCLPSGEHRYASTCTVCVGFRSPKRACSYIPGVILVLHKGSFLCRCRVFPGGKRFFEVCLVFPYRIV